MTLSVIPVLYKSLCFIHSFKKYLLSGYSAADCTKMLEIKEADILVEKRQAILISI